MNVDKRPPVVVSLNVEGFGESSTDTFSVDRDEWEAMTPADRVKLLEEVAEEHAANYVGWGWNIDDPDDYSATETKS